MIFITGDTHGTYDYGKIMSFTAKHPDLTLDDYLIIAGDFGGVWTKGRLKEELRPYTKLHYTVLFVDGNHENFDLLREFPVRSWNGGKVHEVAENVLHLMRGQVYDIEGKLFFTMGGATSIDAYRREQGKSWWPEEAISEQDIVVANRNLDKVCREVDYIVTHSCDERALYYPPLVGRTFQTDIYPENRMLSYIEETVAYKHWYFGHYHMDGDLNPKKTVLYQKVVQIV